MTTTRLPRPCRFGALLVTASFVAGCHRQETPVAVQPQAPIAIPPPPWTDATAIDQASRRIAGYVTLKPGAPITVTRSDGKILITFANILPPGTAGSDFTVKVEFDATSGQVLNYIHPD